MWHIVSRNEKVSRNETKSKHEVPKKRADTHYPVESMTWFTV